MNQLVFVENNRPVTDSLIVAEAFGKDHKRVLQDIRELGCSEEFREHHFVPISYKDSMNRDKPKYIMTEQGFTLLVMGYTGDKAMEFKETYISEFDRMRNELNKPQTLSQLEIMQMSIQQLVEQDKRIKVLEASNNRAEKRIEQLENKIEKKITDEPSLQLILPTQIGKMFEPSISGQDVNKRLQQAGLQWKVGGEWVATVEGRKYSSSEPLQLPNGKVTYQLKWQRRVKDLL